VYAGIKRVDTSMSPYSEVYSASIDNNIKDMYSVIFATVLLFFDVILTLY